MVMVIFSCLDNGMLPDGQSMSKLVRTLVINREKQQAFAFLLNKSNKKTYPLLQQDGGHGANMRMQSTLPNKNIWIWACQQLKFLVCGMVMVIFSGLDNGMLPDGQSMS